MKLLRITSATIFSAFALSAQAGLIFTIEAPGVQSSSVPGVTTETFDSFPTGPLGASATAIGNITAGGTVFSADIFGGANSSQFYRPDGGGSVLTLTTPQNYFGIWWSAGDAANFLEFFDGATSLGSYNVGDIIPVVSSAYYGNPNGGGVDNPDEPYAYLNFTTTGGSHITSVSLGGANFELDNLSVTPEAITPPGTLPDGSLPGVPDSGTTVLLLGAALSGLATLKHKLRS